LIGPQMVSAQQLTPAAAHCRSHGCAGLVFPRFATSKAEMVAAGVIPIDRLTDIRAPIDVVANRCGQPQLEAVYGLQLGPRTLDAASSGTADISAAAGAAGSTSGSSAVGSSVPAAQQGAGHSSAAADQVFLSMGTRLLRSLARARGWAAGSGLPDEVRAGRQILRDYTNGKLLYCKRPPGSPQIGFAPLVAPLPGTVNGMQLEQQQQPGASRTPQSQQQQQQEQEQTAGAVSQQLDAGSSSSGSESEGYDVDAGLPASTSAVSPSPAGAFDASALLLSEADLELMEGLGIGQKAKPKRPEHKFHKKAARSKGTRGLQADAGGYDGAALSTGKKGGLVRVGGY
jgi:large subunit GTPase 1